MAVALAQRKAKLEKLGVFDPTRKQPLPGFPLKIGVATSPAGAALADITAVLSRRWPLATLTLAPTPVQGEHAPAGIRHALEQLDAAGCDVIILSRGGGSKEDLSAFDSEEAVLAVFGCKTPVLCAVGHETDHTLCDYAADARAPTPSAAAEQATPDVAQLAGRIASCERTLGAAATRTLARHQAALDKLGTHPAMRWPGAAVNKCKEKLDIYSKALYNSSRIYMHRQSAQLSGQAAQLDALSPLRVLERGYCIATRTGRVSTAASLEPGNTVHMRFADGAVLAQVLERQIKT